MSIYRGAGGAGDAVADSSSEALLVRELAIEVQADADAAAASATNASNSASSASTSATNAANSASAASTSATNAASSASTATTKASEASTSATNAASSASAASTSASAAATSATNASNSASSASTSASTATTQATNASNSASAAATSATNASNSATAAATSATNAASSASSASTSASAASTSAANALTSANNAETSKNLAANYASNSAVSAADALGSAEAADISEANAASSASAASTSATNAASSASSASTSATNAANSATSAGNSATSAAASAAAAAASYDSFDDRYLGTKTAAPTLDNDGNALVTGALYYNSGAVTPADKGMWVYDGSQWIAASAASTAILTVYRYTATAGQTTFTGADDTSKILTYTAGSAIITVNGAIMEVGTDVTATTGTSIVLAQAALVGDEVNIYAFATFNVANVLQNTSPSILSGNLNFATTGQRITGDFSNATISSRVAFQNSIANAYTNISAIPSGTGGGSQVQLYNNSDPTNSGRFTVSSLSTDCRLNSEITGTGSYLPLTMYTGGSERLRIDTSGNVGIGTNSPLVASGYTTFNVYNGTNGAIIRASDTGAEMRMQTGLTVGYFGTYSNTPLAFLTNSAERMRIDSSGNVGIGTSSPLTALQLGGATNKTIRLDSATGNAAFFGNYNTYTIVASNRNPNTGVFVDTGKASGSILIDANNGVSNITFNTTTSNNTDPTERMRITSGGGVAIGTTAPASLLHINYNSSTANALTVGNNNNGAIYGCTTLGTPIIGSYTGATPIQFGYFSGGISTTFSEYGRFDTSGNLLVGTTSATGSGKVVMAFASGANGYSAVSTDNTTNASFMQMYANGAFCGNITRVGTTSAVLYGSASDYRLKENIKPITSALDKVLSLNPVTYDWKSGGSSEGFIAHELAEVCPTAVNGEKDAVFEDGSINPQSIDQSKLVATLTAAIQEQQAMIEELKAEVAALKGTV